MIVQILVDNPNSWIIPFAKQLMLLIEKDFKIKPRLIHEHEHVIKGDILCLLSCEKIFKKLDFNKHNLVVHESKLPKGKGWSPVTWQVLDGGNKIPVTLFEASDKVDAGKIYFQEYFFLEGTELLPEIKRKQGLMTIELILKFLNQYPNINGGEQKGEETFYAKRTSKDSELNISKPLKEQFDLLRVCDNERYPAFFLIRGKKFILKIYPEDE